jgi:ABC-type phosphate/phosphonate transport system substrate-binding protein
MQRRTFLGLCGVGLAGLVPVPAWARPALSVKVGLTDSIFPNLSPAMLQAAGRPFRVLLESATGLSGQVVQAGNAKGLGLKLKEDRVQLGVFQGIEFAWARQSNPKLEPIVLCVNQDRILRAFLVVRAGSSFHNPDDLRNRTLAIAAEARQHCQVFLRRKCVPDGTPPEKFFKKVVRSADVEEALDDVVDGKVQVAVVDHLAWGSYRKAKAGCARKLRVLLESGPFPCTLVACQQGRFTAARVQHFREGLVAARDTRRGKQLLEFLRMTGFEVPPGDYDQVFVNAARAYPAPAG